ncbi:PAS domain S-box protein [Balneolaceae bacterium YR4-1]|uniref:histidine kinase n=1 Tax=Halalkalibaculum roseum TaxID=2709311 RepID=A0A6M1T698_9BACT|nr:histidine kinase dimerization/phosphoacceptor domain -containing protein [Halalkalibaculum roseum]NGP75823.1 PAS domain S-box protein [Halalkalibaculum roseum]
MKFSTKIIVSFTGATLLLLAIGFTSQYLNNQVRNQVVQESQEAIQELQLSGNMGFDLYKSLINTQYFLEDRYRKSINENTEEVDLNTQRAQKRVEGALGNFQDDIDRFEQVLHSNDKPSQGDAKTRQATVDAVNNLKQKFSIYSSLVKELLVLTRKDYDDGKEFFTVTIEPYFRGTLLPLVDNLRVQTQNNLDQEIDKLNAQLSNSSTFLFLATAVAFLGSIFLAYFLYSSVAYPLKDLALAAKNIGSGNLDERIEVKSRDELGKLAEEFNRMAENLSKTTVSRNFMDDIIESMADSLVVTNESGTIQRVNSSTLEMLGYEEEELKGQPLSNLFSDNNLISRYLDSSNQVENSETKYIKKDGGIIPISLSLGTIHDAEGNKQGIVSVASDITKRKEAEEQITKSLKEKEILLSEIHHRVKNNLAVISGLLQMQIWETDDHAAETALKDSQLRVQSIALVHEKLYQSENLSYIQFDYYIRDLLQAISSTYVDTHLSVNIETELEDIILNINQAIPCSLLLNELIVNAYKHAFDTGVGGNIYVKTRKNDDTIHLYVKDNGIGLPEDFDLEEANSLGMTLINTLTQQLNGEINMKNENGAIFEVNFEVEEVV